MKVLEKILEEIEHEIMTNKEVGRKQCEGMARAMNIIRSHMDDGKDINVGRKSDWIPVENGLPEKSGWYLVQLSVGIPHEDYADRVVVLYDGEEKVFMCYEKLIVAWQPLPEPYKGKEAAGE
jgi:hypothetical protein